MRFIRKSTSRRCRKFAALGLSLLLSVTLIPFAAFAEISDLDSEDATVSQSTNLVTEEDETTEYKEIDSLIEESTDESDDELESTLDALVSASSSEVAKAELVDVNSASLLATDEEVDEVDELTAGTVTSSGTISDGFTWEYYADTNTLVFSGEGSLPNSPRAYQSAVDTTREINVIFKEGITSISMLFYLTDASTTACVDKVILPDTLTSIGISFLTALPVNEIIAPESIYEDYILYGDATRTTVVKIANLQNLTYIEIPESVTTLAASAICAADVSHITLSLPSTLTSATQAYYTTADLRSDMTGFLKIILAEGNETFYINEDLSDEDYGSLMRVSNSNVVIQAVKNIAVEESSGVVYTTDYSTLISASGLTTESYTVDPRCTSISDSAFQNCTSLESITLPDSVTSLASYAFDGCISLETVVLSSGLTSISNYAFRNCESLSDITIPDGVETIGYHCFNGCTNLKSIELPDSITSIGIAAFANTGLTSFVVPPKLWSTVSDYSSFSSDSDSVWDTASIFTSSAAVSFSTSNNSEAVYSKIASIDLSNYGQTYIPAYMFLGLSELTEASIPSNVEIIDQGAFFMCISLEDVYIYGQNVSIAGASTTGDATLGWTSQAYPAFGYFVTNTSTERQEAVSMTGLNFYGLAYSNNDVIAYAENNDCNFIPFVILGDYDATELFGYEITGYNNIVIEDMEYTGQVLTPVVNATFTDVDLTDMVRVLSDDDACSIVYKDANGNTVSEIVAAGTYTAEITGDGKSVFGTTTISFSVVDPNAVDTNDDQNSTENTQQSSYNSSDATSQTSASSDSDATTATSQLAQTGDRVDVTQPLAALAVGALLTTLVAACALSRRTHYRKG